MDRDEGSSRSERRAGIVVAGLTVAVLALVGYVGWCALGPMVTEAGRLR